MRRVLLAAVAALALAGGTAYATDEPVCESLQRLQWREFGPGMWTGPSGGTMYGAYCGETLCQSLRRFQWRETSPGIWSGAGGTITGAFCGA
jgi:hypothetical protein